MKNMLKKYPVLFLLSLIMLSGCSSNIKKQGGEPYDGVFIPGESRTLPLYLLYTPAGQTSSEKQAHRQRFENANLAPGLGAYFPALFSRTEKGWTCSIDTNLSSRIKSIDNLGAELVEYQVEVSGTAAETGKGRRYRVQFPLSALNKKNQSRQPGIYALEQGSLQSGEAAGFARLESLSYNRVTKTFQGAVIITEK
ncbi:MAG: hypothetical protein LBN21_07715 [Treponema sp.]|jgi:hypothetical protein|nr:hypothetical protein [Treponema sp.]